MEPNPGRRAGCCDAARASLEIWAHRIRSVDVDLGHDPLASLGRLSTRSRPSFPSPVLHIACQKLYLFCPPCLPPHGLRSLSPPRSAQRRQHSQLHRHFQVALPSLETSASAASTSPSRSSAATQTRSLAEMPSRTTARRPRSETSMAGRRRTQSTPPASPSAARSDSTRLI